MSKLLRNSCDLMAVRYSAEQRSGIGYPDCGCHFVNVLLDDVAVNPATEEQRQDVASTPVTLGKPELTIPAKRQDQVGSIHEQPENTNLHVTGP